jgi:uncharacterized protein YaiL (DUF2058 family)
MADKKVERSGRERPQTPRQKLKAALSESGNVNMAEPTHDKGKAALIDKFREREERWRREQVLHDQETSAAQKPGEGAAEDEELAKTQAEGEGGVV